jgi:hypothetical protein
MTEQLQLQLQMQSNKSSNLIIDDSLQNHECTICEHVNQIYELTNKITDLQRKLDLVQVTYNLRKLDIKRLTEINENLKIEIKILNKQNELYSQTKNKIK